MGIEEKQTYDLAIQISRFRIIPRMVMLGYSWMVWDTVQWFQGLADPNTQQAALLSVVVGMSGAIFGLYTGSVPSAQRDGAK